MPRPGRCVLLASFLMISLTGARADDPTLKGSVTIYRDTWGVPHIYAKTPAEGAYGLGYAQAEDRLDDIYRNLRTGLGRMAEAFGKKWVDQDYIMRLCRNEELAKSYWKTAPQPIKDVVTGFTAGIQRYVAEHPEKVPTFAFKLEPWQVLTVGRAMILNWPLGTIKDDLENGKKKQRGGQAPPHALQPVVRGPVAIGRQSADPAGRSRISTGRGWP